VPSNGHSEENMLAIVLTLLVSRARAEEVSAEVCLQATPTGQVVPGFGGKLSADHLFLSADGRAWSSQLWAGRATAGVDLLATHRFDLTLGAFVGGTAGWMGQGVGVTGLDSTAGVELGLGARLGPVHARYRHTDGLVGPWADRLSENEVRLGWTFLSSVEVFGQFVTFDPGRQDAVRGLGVGAAVVF